MWFYIHTFFRFTHYSIMALLTIDWFLVFHLNIKYNAVWSPTKLLKTLTCIYIIAFFIFICFVYLIVSKLINWIYVANILFLPYLIWDVLCAVLVIGTYFYTFRKYKEHIEMNKGRKNKAINQEHFKLLVPTLIIVTFILFSCVPDLVNSFIQFYNVEVKDTILYVLGVFYRIVWLVDPIIYIYYRKLFPKKKKFKSNMEKMSSAKQKQAASKAFMIYILMECLDDLLMDYTLMTVFVSLSWFRN